MTTIKTTAPVKPAVMPPREIYVKFPTTPVKTGGGGTVTTMPVTLPRDIYIKNPATGGSTAIYKPLPVGSVPKGDVYVKVPEAIQIKDGLMKPVSPPKPSIDELKAAEAKAKAAQELAKKKQLTDDFKKKAAELLKKFDLLDEIVDMKNKVRFKDKIRGTISTMTPDDFINTGGGFNNVAAVVDRLKAALAASKPKPTVVPPKPTVFPAKK